MILQWMYDNDHNAIFSTRNSCLHTGHVDNTGLTLIFLSISKSSYIVLIKTLSFEFVKISTLTPLNEMSSISSVVDI